MTPQTLLQRMIQVREELEFISAGLQVVKFEPMIQNDILTSVRQNLDSSSMRLQNSIDYLALHLNTAK